MSEKVERPQNVEQRPQSEAGVVEKGGHISGSTAVSDLLGRFPDVLTKPAMGTAPVVAEPAPQPAPAAPTAEG